MNSASILAVFIAYLCIAVGTLCEPKLEDEVEIHGYHFHTYFMQNNGESTQEALNLRTTIDQEIRAGSLGNCSLNRVNLGPVGPHPIGSFETCCNKTSLSTALTFFMQNHGNLSILLHPLTRWEVLDHTTRSMFLGPRYPLDISVLSHDLDERVDRCLPLSSAEEEESSTIQFQDKYRSCGFSQTQE